MSSRKPEPMAVSEAELARMTVDLDQMNRDQAEPAMRASVSEWVYAIRDEKFQRGDDRSRLASRRTFLMGASLIGGATVLAGCGSSSKKATKATTATTTAPSSSSTAAPPTTAATSGLSSTEMQSVKVDAQLENLAVFAYGAALTAAGQGKYGPVPPAIATFITTAKSQHTQHAAAFNAVLSAAGSPATTATDNALTPTVKMKFAAANTLGKVAELAILLENVAAQSYQDDAASFTNMHAAQTAATIMPVEMQHAAILYFVIGKYPGTQNAAGTPLAFNPLTLARPNSDATA